MFLFNVTPGLQLCPETLRELPQIERLPFSQRVLALCRRFVVSMNGHEGFLRGKNTIGPFFLITFALFLVALASNLLAMASNLIAMASNLLAMASKLKASHIINLDNFLAWFDRGSFNRPQSNSSKVLN